MSNLPIETARRDPPEVIANPEAFKQIGEEKSSRAGFRPASYVRFVLIRTDRLELGGIGSEPILSDYSYVLPQRAAPSPAALPRFELPTSPESDLLALLSVMEGEQVEFLLARSARSAAATPELQTSMADLRERWRAEFESVGSFRGRVTATVNLQKGCGMCSVRRSMPRTPRT